MKRQVSEFVSMWGDVETPLDIAQSSESFVVIPEVPSEEGSSYESS